MVEDEYMETPLHRHVLLLLFCLTLCCFKETYSIILFSNSHFIIFFVAISSVVSTVNFFKRYKTATSTSIMYNFQFPSMTVVQDRRCRLTGVLFYEISHGLDSAGLNDVHNMHQKPTSSYFDPRSALNFSSIHQYSSAPLATLCYACIDVLGPHRRAMYPSDVNTSPLTKRKLVHPPLSHHSNTFTPYSSKYRIQETMQFFVCYKQMLVYSAIINLLNYFTNTFGYQLSFS